MNYPKSLLPLPFLCVLCLMHFLSSVSAQVPNDCTQLIVAIAPDWNTDQGHLQLFEKKNNQWVADSAPWPVLFGKSGLAWGRGIVGQNEKGAHKQERDHRAPAGIFRMGTIYTYDSALPPGSSYTFHQVNDTDAWVDDPTLPEYNKHISVDLKNPPVWFEKQKMRKGDFAYRWLVEIRHNADSIVPGAGSAIFFHIRRGETRPTSGCTTMAESDLVYLITWLRPAAHPCYVLLPRAEYRAKMKSWKLPEPSLALLGR